MKKLLILSPVGGAGNGADISMNFQMKYLSSLGYKIYLVTRSPLTPEYESFLAKNNITAYYFDYSWWFDSELNRKEANIQDAVAIGKLVDIIRTQEIDMAISNTANIPQLALAAALGEIPHLWLVHEFPEGEFSYTLDKYDFIASFSNEILASSKVLANRIEKISGTTPVSFFNPYADVSGKQLKEEVEPSRIVSVNHVSKRKNTFELVRIFEKLKERNSDLQLIITGGILDEAYHQEILAYIKENAIDRVVFSEKPEANFEDIQANDIFVNTSSMETFGLTTVEALKLGLVCIAADTAVLALNELGYFSEDTMYSLGNIDEAVQKIQVKLEDIQAVKNEIQRLQEQVLKEQSLEAITANLVKAIESYDSSPRKELGHFENLFPFLKEPLMDYPLVKKLLENTSTQNNLQQKKIQELETQIDTMYRSNIWKAGRIVTLPLRQGKRAVQKYKAAKKVPYTEWILKNEGRADTISFTPNGSLEIKDINDDFFYILDKAAMMADNALTIIQEHLSANTNLLYFDSDEVINGKRVNPYFKPDYSPDLALNTNYFGSFVVFRKGILPTPDNDVNMYDFILKFVEQVEENTIHHIAKVLSHLPADATAQDICPIVEKALERRALKAQVTQGKIAGFAEISYDIVSEDLVSIVIPTRNGYADLKNCIDSIIEKTTYPNYEIIVADNESDDPKMSELYQEYEEKLGQRFTKLSINIPFNYSKINNLAVQEAKGKYILLLNNDTSVIEPEWLTNMVSFCQFERIGCVGAKLLYPDNTIQHAGVVLGHGGTAGHAFLFKDRNDNGYHNFLNTDYNYSAVTAACLMVKKEDYDKVGGLAEEFEVAYNDIDFCLRIKELGKDNLLAHKALLYHYESKSRGLENTPEKQARFNTEVDKMEKSWGRYLIKDPAYNPNFTRENAFFELPNPNPFAHERPIYRRVGSLGKRALRKAKSITRNRYYQLKSVSLRKRRDKERQNRFDNTLLIYVIYNENGPVEPYKLAFYHAIEKYAQRIRIVVNGMLEDDDYQTLSQNADILIRENTGYDAAGFRAGVLSFSKDELKEYGRLMLINDTNIGPLHDFEQVFEKMNPKAHDFWGLLYGKEDPVDSTGLNPFGYFPKHIQTYFLVVESGLLHSSDFYGFYEKMPDTNSRNMAIARYETYLTKYFEDRGFRSSVYVETDKYNDPYQYPLTLVRDFDFPIVKKAALQYYNNDLMEAIRWQGARSEVPELVEYFAQNQTAEYDFIMKALEEYKNK